jgi:very-short-patch-repair endonuclease
VIVELDGWEFHHDRDAFERDRHRDVRLQLAGYTVLRFTWDRVTTDPEGVVADVGAALTQRGAVRR